MKSSKDLTHAFVVRIWIESREIEKADPIWRGVIEQVDSGQRTYFDQLNKISSFFAKYLDYMGIQTGNQVDE